MSSAIDGEARAGVDFLNREIGRLEDAVRRLVGQVREIEVAQGLRQEPAAPVEDPTPSDVEPAKAPKVRKGKGA